ncbi:hypothetical protein BDR06DRAFT_970248 [Suillus hirtellus]|nr:hypothetical protein BDR06DRAFT_970248 [Suillus hirtellus]
MAAAKKAHALPNSHSSPSQTCVTAHNISQPQIPVTTHSVQDPILSRTNSSAVLPDVNFYQNLDPAFWLPVPQMGMSKLVGEKFTGIIVHTLVELKSNSPLHRAEDLTEGDEAAENILGVVDDLIEDSSNDGTVMNQKSAPQLLYVAEVNTSNLKAKQK